MPLLRLVSGFVLVAARFAAADELTFAPLFNGRDLAGWVDVNCAPDTFTVKEGMIVCSGKPTGVLRTAKRYENYVLELEYRHLHAGGNAGLFVHSDPLTARGQPFTRSIEVQVMDGVETADYTSHGDVFSIHGATMTPDRPHPAGWARCLPSEKRAKPSPEWNHYRVTCNAGTLKLEVNGKEVSGASAIAPREGFICLEAEGSEVHFRNLRIAEMPPSGTLSDRDRAASARGFRALLNGKDLTGWRDAASHTAHWKMNDWVLAYDGQGADLWTEEEFEDFELIADWRWSAKPQDANFPDIQRNGEQALNDQGQPKTVTVKDAGDSGIFLRGNPKSQVNIWCWPVGSGEIWGYRTDPASSAELKAACTPKVTADAPIGQWNRFHITVKGDVVNVALNGKPVIVDAVLPGMNKRGPIALQHHGSPLEFANLYVREITPEVPQHRATTPGPHYEERMNQLAERARASDATVAFVGDSITQGWEGEGRGEWERRFAPLSSINLGISGDQTQHVVNRFQRGDYEGLRIRTVVMMIGTNNIGNDKHSPRETADGVRAILNEISDRWPRSKVLLLGVFPRGEKADNPYRAQVRELNGYLAGYADDRRVFFSDIGEAFLAADGSLPKEIMPDFLHLSEKGYAIWAERIDERVRALTK
jgi:lysophospholipase L1-like esterase